MSCRDLPLVLTVWLSPLPCCSSSQLDEQEAATEKTAKHAKATLVPNALRPWPPFVQHCSVLTGADTSTLQAAAQGIERRFDAKEAAIAQARQSLLVRERTVQEKEVEAARVALENKERTQELARSRLKVAANRTRLQVGVAAHETLRQVLIQCSAVPCTLPWWVALIEWSRLAGHKPAREDTCRVAGEPRQAS